MERCLLTNLWNNELKPGGGGGGGGVLLGRCPPPPTLPLKIAFSFPNLYAIIIYLFIFPYRYESVEWSFQTKSRFKVMFFQVQITYGLASAKEH